jgi:uncharacterized membrane protein (Fun14 family)
MKVLKVIAAIVGVVILGFFSALWIHDLGVVAQRNQFKKESAERKKEIDASMRELDRAAERAGIQPKPVRVKVVD